MDTSSSQNFSSSSSSSSPNLPSTRAQRRGSRTTSACEACKKRKSKCSGPRGPCEACRKVKTFCHFNARLDARRKLAYKPAAVQKTQQYILHALLQTLKSGDNDEILKLISLIQSEAPPQNIAGCLRRNIQSLQDRGILPPLNIDETDLVSLGLQGLLGHPVRRPGLKQSSSKSPSNPKVTPKRLEELRLRPESVNETDLSTPSPSCSRHGSHVEGHGGFLAFTNEPSLVSRPVPLDSMSQGMCHSSSGVSSPFTTLSPCSPTRNIASETDPKYVMLCRSHSLTNVIPSNQSFSNHYATGPIAPHTTFSMALGNSVHAEYPSLQIASPGDNLFMGYRDGQPGMSANVYALERLNDSQRAEHGLAISHKMPRYQ